MCIGLRSLISITSICFQAVLNLDMFSSSVVVCVGLFEATIFARPARVDIVPCTSRPIMQLSAWTNESQMRRGAEQSSLPTQPCYGTQTISPAGGTGDSRNLANKCLGHGLWFKDLPSRVRAKCPS
ncbi:hypothetical protein DOTSEDRAFT_73269 [Dothistroma septosporum NZE10]|uniref:Uncharacterized protein n=1 Tax=Dothistroma septosporum (strain NZE10 / CBS 128990) TaxID=675120 RepID=N1PM34_DOTSN|nr:hypothetical protein DOTSEDRAFT_73269 [Dothistroma septosporum NZE10]